MTYRLHLESRRQQHSSFHLDEAAWALAATRHPDLARQVDVSFGWDGSRFADPLDDVDFLLASRFPWDAVNGAARLRWIHTTGAGVDQLLPLDTVREDLILTNSRGIHSDKAQEFVQMALLMLHARMASVFDAQRNRRWDTQLTPPLRGKTALVIGYGNLGSAACAAACALGLHVSVLTRGGNAQVHEGVEADCIARLDEWLPRTDFLIVAAPLTPQTHMLVSASRISAMRPGAAVVNISRAGLIDYPALFDNLRSGHLSGAVLDVFDPEPLPAESEAWSVPNLVVTPHISCDVPDYNQRVLDVWFRNFKNFLSNKPFENVVNRQLGY
ncbi:D-2-hydroxyacid dehydrogenase [Caballeronia sp. DA-9]|uniref:D-2-hydroxyacid dehydrogenase n=1 Tax=Caballeronia sp. DA-9 TaxID=3436237 RepID=UPI003F67F7CE